MKAKRIIRFNIEDEAHLQRIVSVRLRWWAAIPLCLAVLAAVVALAVIIIMYTPLKTTLPGYLPPKERAATIQGLVKVDSLQRKYDVNQAYIDNLLTVLDPDRATGDSVKWAEKAITASKDSLMPTSRREKEFRSKMDERERYNLSILAPLAADGMIFEEPAPGYTFSHGCENSYTSRIIIPTGELIRTVMDGTVADIHFLPSTGYCMVIQHGNGFLSRWSRIGFPLVQEGETVAAGQVIAPTMSGSGRDASYVTLELWRNGTRLVPFAILKNERKLAAKVDDKASHTPAK